MGRAVACAACFLGKGISKWRRTDLQKFGSTPFFFAATGLFEPLNGLPQAVCDDRQEKSRPHEWDWPAFRGRICTVPTGPVQMLLHQLNRDQSTSSISPGFQVLSNQGSSGPYSRRIVNSPCRAPSGSSFSFARRGLRPEQTVQDRPRSPPPRRSGCSGSGSVRASAASSGSAGRRARTDQKSFAGMPCWQRQRVGLRAVQVVAVRVEAATAYCEPTPTISIAIAGVTAM